MRDLKLSNLHNIAGKAPALSALKMCRLKAICGPRGDFSRAGHFGGKTVEKYVRRCSSTSFFYLCRLIKRISSCELQLATINPPLHVRG